MPPATLCSIRQVSVSEECVEANLAHTIIIVVVPVVSTGTGSRGANRSQRPAIVERGGRPVHRRYVHHTSYCIWLYMRVHDTTYTKRHDTKRHDATHDTKPMIDIVSFHHRPVHKKRNPPERWDATQTDKFYLVNNNSAHAYHNPLLTRRRSTGIAAVWHRFHDDRAAIPDAFAHSNQKQVQEGGGGKRASIFRSMMMMCKRRARWLAGESCSCRICFEPSRRHWYITYAHNSHAYTPTHNNNNYNHMITHVDLENTLTKSLFTLEAPPLDDSDATTLPTTTTNETLETTSNDNSTPISTTSSSSIVPL
jgi:hypothetical protein